MKKCLATESYRFYTINCNVGIYDPPELFNFFKISADDNFEKFNVLFTIYFITVRRNGRN